MKFTTTGRGFALVEFIDRYGDACTLQKSSLAGEDAIWLGASGNVRAMGPNGWEDVDLRDRLGTREVIVSSRMHLTREQVAELIPLLQHFVDTGEVVGPEGHAALDAIGCPKAGEEP